MTKNLIVSLAIIFSICLALLPFKQSDMPVSSAETSVTDLVVLDSEIGNSFVESNAETLNGAALTSYTPIQDFSTGDRYAGNALQCANYKTTFTFENLITEDISDQSEKSLFVWVYMPSTESVMTNITLSGLKDGISYALKWTITSDKFFSRSESVVANDLIVPGWRLIELPFEAASHTINNVEDNPVYLKYLNTFTIEQDPSSNFLVALFNIYVSDYSNYMKIVETPEVTALPSTEQGYSIVSVKETFINYSANKLAGDNIVTPTFSNSYSYAWIGNQKISNLQQYGTLLAGIKYKNGENEILVTESEIEYKWQIRISSANMEAGLFGFGEQVGKFEAGTYSMSLVLRGKIDDVWRDLASGPILEIVVPETTNPIWFKSFSTSIDMKYVYTINFSFDNVHWQITDPNNFLVVSSSNEQVLEIVDYSYNGNVGTIQVRGLKPGTATINISAECVRTEANTGRGVELFTAKTSIEIQGKSKNTDKIILIVLGSVLGATILVGLIIGIVKIVKHNKMNVK